MCGMRLEIERGRSVGSGHAKGGKRIGETLPFSLPTSKGALGDCRNLGSDDGEKSARVQIQVCGQASWRMCGRSELAKLFRRAITRMMVRA